jgi:hypothetical protein
MANARKRMSPKQIDEAVRRFNERAPKLKALPMTIAVMFRDGYLTAVGRRELSTNSIEHNEAFRAGFNSGKRGDTHAQADAALDSFARTIGHTWQTT